MPSLKIKVALFLASLITVFSSMPGTFIIPVLAQSKPTQDSSTPSPAQCLEAIEKLLRRTSMSTTESEQATALLRRCQTTFWVLPNPNASLPTATECINFLSLIVDSLSKNSLDKITTIPVEQQQSLSRCHEVSR
jgi:hypothetical protein